MPNPIALLRNDMLVASFRTLRSPNAALRCEQRITKASAYHLKH